MKRNKKYLAVCLLITITYISSCRKFTEASAPVTSTSSGNVYTKDYTAIAVLTAIYMEMSVGDGRLGLASLSMSAGLCADELTLFNITDTRFSPFYQNNLAAISLGMKLPPEYWAQLYQYIYQVNAAIEGVNASNSLTPGVKNQLLGEAYFMRAFFYFYLVNLYGDVPLVLSTNYKTNAGMERTDKTQVYQQMITDLEAAQGLLSDSYMDASLLQSTTERIRPNKGTATALLSRVYLYAKDYPNAEAQATLLIDNSSAYALVDLDQVFKKNSMETIWSLQPVANNQNTWESIFFLLPETGPNSANNQVYLSNQQFSSFDNNDQRLNAWTGNVTVGGIKYVYAAKYKAGATSVLSEYEMVFRLAEQYLIRAEARAQQDKLAGINSASSDLNAIRARAGLLPTTATTKPELLDAILEERQREFFTEWGHRWFDLKRTEKIDNVMTIVCPLKGGEWESFKALFPIPQDQISVNPGMQGQQNPGYNN